jgi:hypothetical protein
MACKRRAQGVPYRHLQGRRANRGPETSIKRYRGTQSGQQMAGGAEFGASSGTELPTVFVADMTGRPDPTECGEGSHEGVKEAAGSHGGNYKGRGSAGGSRRGMKRCRGTPSFRVVPREFSILRRSGTSPSYGGRRSPGVIRFRQ